jgi:hypothetical protein
MGATDPIFVGGVPRSGTTLLRVILDTHPNIHCGTELRVVQALANLWTAADRTGQPLLTEAYGVDDLRLRAIFSELILAFLEPAWRASGKPRTAEKTPWNLLVFPELHRLFPASPLVHVIRDGRDVVASRLERDRATSGAQALDTVALAAKRAQEWVDAMVLRSRMRSDPDLASGYYEIRYEELVVSPEAALRNLFAFLDEPFEPAVLDFHHVSREVSGSEEWSAANVRRPIFESSIGRWRQSLDAREARAVEDVAGPTLLELGYGTDGAGA